MMKDDGGGVANSQPWPVESEVLSRSEEISDTSKLVSCRVDLLLRWNPNDSWF